MANPPRNNGFGGFLFQPGQKVFTCEMANSLNKNILIIGEFPVIHRGYIDFFNKILKRFKRANFYFGFFDKKTVKGMTRLEPDIRKIPIPEVKKIIKAELPVKKFFLFSKNNFSKLIKDIAPQKIFILKGDKSENFAKNFLTDEKYKKIVQYFDIRLKWPQKRVAEFKKESSYLSKKELTFHKKFMKEAFREAENSRCWWRRVGAVLVKEGKVILKAFNEMMPFPDECYKIGCIRDEIPPGELPEVCSGVHAEAAIVASAAREGMSLQNTAMYVTHFPCPACAKSIALSGIKKLVYSKGSAVFDGAKVMRDRGVEVIKI